MIRLNVLAPSRLALAAISEFVGRGRGTLINISSAAALAPERLNGSYSGTKAYLLNLSLRLQQEVAGKGVRVQVVLPGATRTAIWEKVGTNIASLPPGIVMNVDEILCTLLSSNSVPRISLAKLQSRCAYSWRRHAGRRTDSFVWY